MTDKSVEKSEKSGCCGSVGAGTTTALKDTKSTECCSSTENAAKGKKENPGSCGCN